MIAVLALLLLGVLAARIPAMPERATAVLDTLVIWLVLPAVILTEVPRLALGASALVPVAVAWGTLGVLAGVILALARVRGWRRATVGTLLLVVPLGNTSFFGIPAITALLGADHVGPALVYDQLGTFLGLATWGTLIAARYGGTQGSILRATARRALTFPPLIALGAALVLRAVPLPAPVAPRFAEVTGRLGAMLVPLTMLSVGMRLRLPRARGVVEPLAIGLVLALGVAPLLAWSAMRALGGAGVVWETSVLEAAMPPMVTAGVVAAAAGLDEELASALVGVGLLCALVTVPLWAALLTS